MARKREWGWIQHTRRQAFPFDLVTQGSLYSQSQSNLRSSVSNNEGEKSVAKEMKVVNSPSLDTFRHKLFTLLEAVLHPKTEPTT